ncbi:aconitase [Anaerolinea thermolimosa]|uniref:aconitate hydratase AcnA n=1 Tax=Anaerolinea thermolimosa TaxID=229919 RepID=UPI00078607BA|nr:aconitate hydratase AcnA [Anaerolinea thermolimosa]GAP06317.1 aconitase [Anaerolinea thermolimosa]
MKALHGMQALAPLGSYYYFDLTRAPGIPADRLHQIPYCIRVLLEGLLRNWDDKKTTADDVYSLAAWQPRAERRPTQFYAGRVVLQDFTGVPVMNDLAAMRSALKRLGGPPEKINPVVPVDLVIDHSVQVDYFGSPDAFEKNVELEFERNRERYEFLHWAQKAFKNFRVVPPSTGIVHQVNLEYLARGVLTRTIDGKEIVFPETLVGTDSHTTMINGLSVIGFGVGGIEAVAAMLGEPLEIVTPDVIGIRLTGKLQEGVTPTDLTLTITQELRKIGVVDKFVEFFGPGLSNLTLADRAMISNMAPETGATVLYWPVDQQTLEYLRLTGRPTDLVEAYYRAQALFRTDDSPEPQYTLTLDIDLASIEPSLAGPKRPQDRVSLRNVQQNFHQSLLRPRIERGFGLTQTDISRRVRLKMDHRDTEMTHGSVVIAAITSCTNTSNPYVMIGAGLLAKKAVEKGLTTQPYVKTSLAPGSRVVTAYLKKAGLIPYLEKLGFHLVGYGCTTCIGNSGPLPEPVVEAINQGNLVAAAVLSGNRNFEGRVHPSVQANYLASPPLVVAYALAGNIQTDLTTDPLGNDREGRPVYLRDIWPSNQEILETIHTAISPDLFISNYSDLFTGNPTWNAIQSGSTLLYEWRAESTYLQEPPFFADLSQEMPPVPDILGARVLGLFGDSITTDHISPAGNISPSSPAGKYLLEQGVPIHEFNSYGSRRGNDRVMTRGTFANIRLKNLLLGGQEGSFTIHFPSEEKMSFYDAAMRYRDEKVPLIIIAGKEYGTGSSRDWAAKGVQQLGVRAVLAESFERIHRSNLAGMGVLPLQFKPGENAASHGITGKEVFNIRNLHQIRSPGGEIVVEMTRTDGTIHSFPVIVRLDTKNEVEYFHHRGILNTILLNLA